MSGWQLGDVLLGGRRRMIPPARPDAERLFELAAMGAGGETTP